mmetsp:Transcript_10898/g.22190  ORF Transcript_10898/g.22190 Transcript_10898/m.22190 type:complete len:228 (-) Transcript_10898:349-1032(-)
MALVLGAEIHAPLHGLVELGLLLLLLQDINGLRVCQALERRGHQVFQSGEEALLDLLLEKIQVGPVVLHRVGDAVLEVVLSALHVIEDVREGELGLNHPELGQVPRGVRVLRPEGGPEGVDARQGAAVVLDTQLPAHRQEGWLAEEVLAVVDFLLGGHRQPALLRIGEQRGDLEHLPRTLAVRGRNERCVDIDEAAVPEELMRRVGQSVAHTGHGPDENGTRPEVAD